MLILINMPPHFTKLSRLTLVTATHFELLAVQKLPLNVKINVEIKKTTIIFTCVPKSLVCNRISILNFNLDFKSDEDDVIPVEFNLNQMALEIYKKENQNLHANQSFSQHSDFSRHHGPSVDIGSHIDIEINRNWFYLEYMKFRKNALQMVVEILGFVIRVVCRNLNLILFFIGYRGDNRAERIGTYECNFRVKFVLFCCGSNSCVLKSFSLQTGNLSNLTKHPAFSDSFLDFTQIISYIKNHIKNMSNNNFQNNNFNNKPTYNQPQIPKNGYKKWF